MGFPSQSRNSYSMGGPGEVQQGYCHLTSPRFLGGGERGVTGSLQKKSGQEHWATSFAEVNQHHLSGISGTMTIFIGIRPFTYGEEVVKITKGRKDIHAWQKAMGFSYVGGVIFSKELKRGFPSTRSL